MASSIGVPNARRGALAATHHGELVDLVSEAFDAYHFGDSVGPDGLTFDHRLQRGSATTRNAIALLRLHGAPETLLAQAVTTAEMLDRQRGLLSSRANVAAFATAVDEAASQLPSPTQAVESSDQPLMRFRPRNFGSPHQPSSLSATYLAVWGRPQTGIEPDRWIDSSTRAEGAR